MILKSGDKAISTVIRRCSSGLELNVRLHEAVEEFFRASAGDEIIPIDLFGRKWLTSEKLQVYDLPEPMSAAVTINEKTYYRLDKPGSDLVTTNSLGHRCINMSFVRLVGASSEDGVTFRVSGVFEKDDVIALAGAITEAGNLICKKYIYPMIISTNNVIRAEAAEPLPNAL